MPVKLGQWYYGNNKEAVGKVQEKMKRSKSQGSYKLWKQDVDKETDPSLLGWKTLVC